MDNLNYIYGDLGTIKRNKIMYGLHKKDKQYFLDQQSLFKVRRFMSENIKSRLTSEKTISLKKSLWYRNMITMSNECRNISKRLSIYFTYFVNFSMYISKGLRK